jgi:uncharacterized protein YjeT (DUF2065 family)
MILFQLIPIIFILFGVLNVIYPRASWYMKTGWQFKNAEPSELALTMIRIGGIISIAIGIFILVSGFPFNNGLNF